MMIQRSRQGQKGVALIVGLIMLVLITLVVVSAFRMSSSNLRLVGNVQVRNEATAAANQVIERVVSSAFYQTGAQSATVDINKDGTNDFTVQVAAPVCARAWVAASSEGSDVELPMMASSIWYTEWDIDATASDPASGASVRVRQGVRVAMPESDKNLYCP